MQMTKRILSFALVLVMVLSCIPVTALAADSTPALPTASVTEIKKDDLTFALNFKVDPVTQEQLAYYGNWYADFELTINKDVTFNNDGSADGWLAGQYDEYSSNWLTVPFGKYAPVTLKANQTLKIMAFAAEQMDEPGLKYTYKEIYETVRDFDCGVYFDDEFLAANPDLEVKLELKMYNPANESENYVIGQTYTYGNPVVAKNTTTNKVYTSAFDALMDCAEGQTVVMVKNSVENMLYVLEDTTLNLNGYTLVANYVTSYGTIIDTSVDNSGLLEVPANRIMLREKNKQLPVRDGNGYRFVQVLDIATAYIAEQKMFAFQVYFEPEMLELLKRSQEDTEVTIEVKVSWKEDNGYRSQNFIYIDEFVQTYLNSYNSSIDWYGEMFTLILDSTDEFQDLTFTAVVVSKTGVERSSADPTVEEPSYTVPTGLTATYGQTLADVTLPDGFEWKNPSASVGNAGNNTFIALHTASYTEVEVTVAVAKANPTYEIPANLTANYGQTLADVALPEGFVWKNPGTSVGDVGVNTFAAIFTPADAANFNTVEVSVPVTVLKINPDYTVPTGLVANYGQTLGEIALPDGFAWVDANASVGNAGVNTFAAIFTPADPANYNAVEVSVSVTVLKINPDYTVPTGLVANYGQTLGEIALPDGFTWKDASASVGNAGENTFAAIFTPADPANFNAVEVSVPVTVLKINPDYTVPTGLVANYGQTLGEIALPDGFTWKDASASVGNAGVNTFTAIFTPADPANYNAVEVSVSVTVLKINPDYTIPTGLVANYGQTLGEIVLPDGFAWVDASASVGNAGVNTFAAIFTPADPVNFNTVEVSVPVTVLKINPDYTVPTGLTAIYGQKLSGIALPEGFAWKDANASVGNAGTNSLKVVFTPNDTDNYNIVEVSVTVEVAKADPTPVIPTGLTANYGQKLSEVTPGDRFTWNTPDTTLNEVGVKTFKATYTPADTQNYNIITVDIQVEVQQVDVEKFGHVFPNTTSYLYRVGNKNSVALGKLFKAKDGVTIGNVSVTIETVTGATGTYAEKSAWENSTLQFEGTGVVKVTITDDNFCIPTVLYLEVVDATNATSAMNADTGNVVLLNNIGSGFTVSGNYTFYGNGFTLTYTGNGQYLNNGLKQGVVTVKENGTLDNLHIQASIYPRAYLYYGATLYGDYVQGGPYSQEGEKIRYHYQLSAVAASGNATIANCYIYGGRTNIFVDTGDVTITDTVLECGTVANVQIQSANTHVVTLNNVTTIQKRVNATIDDTSKVMLGAGVLVGPDTTSNPTIVLKGSFKQYNWVNADDKSAVSDEMVQAIVGGALNATQFNHTVNGKTASNLGIIFMNEDTVKVTNETGLPYQFATIKMTLDYNSVNGQAYSLQGATGEQIFSDIENADRDTVNGDYLPKMDFDLGDQEVSYEGGSDNRYLYGDANGVIALYQDGNSPLTLDLTKLATIYKYTGRNYPVTAVCKNAAGTVLATNDTVTLSTAGQYILEFTITDDIFYDQNGNPITKSVSKTFTVPLELTVKEAEVKDAVVNITKTALDGVYTTVNFNDYKLRINFLDCISVTDYDNSGAGATVSLSSNIASVALTPASVNVFTTAFTATITYKDGRVLTVNFSKISGSSPGTKTAVINTSGGLYFITEGALDNKPTASSSQNKCTITSVSFKGNSGATITNDTDVTVTWALGSSSGGGGCVTGDTLVTLADGSVKRIDEVTNDDLLLTWNFFEGKYDVVPSAIIFNHGAVNNTVIELTFSDGTKVKVVNLHQFFNADLNRFVTIDAETVAEYVGQKFAKLDGNGNSVVELVSYTVTEEYVEAWGIISALHYNIIVEGMLSADFEQKDFDLFNYFEVGAEMKFDEEKMQADIEKYGLYTYEDFAEYLTHEQFVAFNVQYFKIPVGKGIYTYEGILELIDQYLK